MQNICLTACQYDVILSQNFKSHIGIGNFFSTDNIRWIDWSVKMKLLYHYILIKMSALIYEIHDDGEALL